MVVTKKAVEHQDCINKVTGLLVKLQVEYTSVSPYILSFIHRSIVNEKPDFAPEHNERLEFLWDAVLELAITENLFSEFPDYDEWKLTDIRSAIVRGKNLAIISKDLGFDQFLFLGNGEELSWGRSNEYILANCVEAFLWAIFIDAWFVQAKRFVDTYIYSSLKHIFENNLLKDFKSLVQEYAQAEYDVTPTYKIHADFWPDHDKVFEVWIYIGETLVWVGKGSSKKKAQEGAAQEAYMTRESWNIPS